MKKAFSLLELIFTLILICVLVLLLSKPLQTLYVSYDKGEFDTEELMDLAHTLLLIEKIMRDCYVFNTGLSCLLQDRENILQMRQKNVFIGSSGVILQDNNKSFYAPKSSFSYDFIEDKKTYQGGVLINHQNLRQDYTDSLHFYSLKEKQSYKAKVKDDKIFFENQSFSGFYILLLGNMQIYKKDEALIYNFTPYLSSNSFENVLLKGVSRFDIQEFNDSFLLELCKNKHCLKKWIKK